MRFVLAVALVLAAAACGSHAAPKLAVSRDGRAVLRDAYDGKLDRNWSCGSLRAAYRRLPQDPPAYSTIPGLIGNAAGKACDAALATVRAGTRKAGVVEALGPPDRAPRCWLYSWPPDHVDSTDGARICFAAGRATLVQTAVHA